MISWSVLTLELFCKHNHSHCIFEIQCKWWWIILTKFSCFYFYRFFFNKYHTIFCNISSCIVHADHYRNLDLSSTDNTFPHRYKDCRSLWYLIDILSYQISSILGNTKLTEVSYWYLYLPLGWFLQLFLCFLVGHSL